MLVRWRIVLTIPRCVSVILAIWRFSDFVLFSLLGNSSPHSRVISIRISKHRLVNYLSRGCRTLDNASHLCCVNAIDLVVCALVKYAEANGLLFTLTLLIFAIRRGCMKAQILCLGASDRDILEVVVHHSSICALGQLPTFLYPALLEQPTTSNTWREIILILHWPPRHHKRSQERFVKLFLNLFLKLHKFLLNLIVDVPRSLQRATRQGDDVASRGSLLSLTHLVLVRDSLRNAV